MVRSFLDIDVRMCLLVVNHTFDLKQRVDRKTKQVECMVHYKKTHTNINVKERSNHPPSMKKGIIKGFADRARALCDDKHLEDELKNVEDVFVANGYDRKVVTGYEAECTG